VFTDFACHRYARVRPIISQDVLAEIQELSTADSEDVPRAKALIAALDSTLRAEEYALADGFAKSLLKCRFLPARTNAGVELCEAGKCYIPDDTAVAELYASQFPMVDTTLQEIAQLRSLIECLNLNSRLLSVAVTRDTKVSRQTINESRTEELRRKVQWFCKLSDAPTEEMLAFLSKTTVWDVKAITVTYRLEEKVATRTTDTYWVEKKDGINIYVSPKATASSWAYVDQDLSTILAEECAIKKAKYMQLLQTLLRIPADEIPAFLERQRGINRTNFELVDSWLTDGDGQEAESEGTMSAAGDADMGEAPVGEDGDMEGSIQDESKLQDADMAEGENATQGGVAAQDDVAQNRNISQDDVMFPGDDMDDDGPVAQDGGAPRDNSAGEGGIGPQDNVAEIHATPDLLPQERPQSRSQTVCLSLPRPSSAGGSSTGSAAGSRRRRLPDEEGAAFRTPKRSRTRMRETSASLSPDDGFPNFGGEDHDDDEVERKPDPRATESDQEEMLPGPATPEPQQLNMTINDDSGGPSLAANIKGESIVSG
jgi:hypothetical protein